MGTFLKVCLLVAVVIVGVMLLSHSESGGYSPSEQRLDPIEISKNPYKFQGQSGVLLDTPYLGMTFVNMLDEHTAAYKVNVGALFSTDEIAVNLEDSNPPDPARPWRVYVEGPTDVTNGFGASEKIGTVRFEGYYDPPPPPIQPAATPLPQPTEVQPEPPAQPQASPDANETPTPPPQEPGQQPPAPIVRQPPPQE